ncbi:MAG TPA: DNA-binding response regulator [Gemmatimonas aurantiaca]|uniref:OmpR family two-component response regulator n=2 Tax=Gemmatimonas aurantiaca TaxID=173480 RepID=C1ACD7_GEMAT|nr:response regulator transcription factor [Gemmatimonas aurantiaca]BAH40164.1 OmpR family two-component response regulator [Gemmatimonas aurantiaca T-27]HCT57827.1 DNA-binding response regulator [Gemmatimonas aurantiaca]
MARSPIAEWPDPDTLLVVEDDDALRETLAQTLGTMCRQVRTASSLAEAVRECAQVSPQLVLLDLGLPDGDGSELLRQLRGVTDVPIIVLSGRDDEDEKVAILDAGADDFISKPCGAAELQARVRGQIRRAAISHASRAWSVLTVDGVEIDLQQQRVVRRGELQRLTPTEWSLLRALVLHAGRPMSPRQLWDIVWDREFGDFATHVRVHITHLRRKIEPDASMPRLIITEPGVGYRFNAPS